MDLLFLRETEGVGSVPYDSYEPSLAERMPGKIETKPGGRTY